jgi:two-component system chemotaxis sensor kinase CheA
MDSETQEIIDYFLTESRESVAEVEPLLIGLEAGGAHVDRATIDKIFRLFHSMKGSAGFLEFQHVESVTHQAETLLDRVRNGTLTFDPPLVDLLCRALDFTNDALDAIEAMLTDASLAEEAAGLIQRLKGFGGAPSAEPARAPVAPAPVAAKPPSAPPPAAPPPPAAEAWTGPQPAAARGEINVFAPVAAPSAAETDSGLSSLFDSLSRGAKIERSLPTPEPSSASVAPSPRAPSPQGTAPAKPAASPHRLGEILIEAGLASPAQIEEALKDKRLPVGQKLVQMQVVPPERIQEALAVQSARRGDPDKAAEEEDGKGRSRAEYLRVDVRKLDQLMDLIGELIIAETAVTHGPARDTEVDGSQKAAVQLNRVTRGLQDVAMSLRMVPIEPTFKKMVRLVRDLSRRQGKRITLEISGEDTEVDKSVVEAISDPLVHLIRNSIDHGVEDVDERIRVGKAPEGRITLSARQQAGEIRIEVRDDGRGLDRARILKKGVERGLVKGDGAELSDAEVYKLIFEPGFSTAAAVTDISGRGVGMDVVKQNIESVKGRVEVQSTPGAGSVMALRIPLTLAIIEGMLVRVGTSRFTLPILSITETVGVTARDVTRLTNGAEVVRVRGRLLPVYRLHELYELKPDSTRIEDGLLVVIEDGNDRVCVLVDELIGQRQTVVKSLSGYLGSVRGLAGCTVLGDGSISLIIDVAKLIHDVHAAA